MLALFKDALPIAELARGLIELANLSIGRVQVSDAMHALMQGVPVSSGVAVNGAAHPTRDAGERFESAQAERDRAIDQILQYGAGRNRDALLLARLALDFDGSIRIAQHHAGEAFITGDQVGSAADHRIRRLRGTKRADGGYKRGLGGRINQYGNGFSETGIAGNRLSFE